MLQIKIKRNTYNITEHDTFMDNGVCIQLMTQTNEYTSGFGFIYPKLSKKVIKEISKYKRVLLRHAYGDNIQVFKLDGV